MEQLQIVLQGNKEKLVAQNFDGGRKRNPSKNKEYLQQSPLYTLSLSLDTVSSKEGLWRKESIEFNEYIIFF